MSKEAQELVLLRGQSSLWLFLEDFHISKLAFNVTLALSSNFGGGGGADPSDVAAMVRDCACLPVPVACGRWGGLWGRARLRVRVGTCVLVGG